MPLKKDFPINPNTSTTRIEIRENKLKKPGFDPQSQEQLATTVALLDWPK